MTEPPENQQYWRSPFEELSGEEASVQDESQNQNTGGQEEGIIGTPEEDARTFDGQQSYDDTCTIRCQEFILEQFTGQEWDEAALVQQAEENGWYTPGEGTTFEHTSSLLEAHGIPTTHYENANVYHLANELAQGHKVILSVDADELWGQENPVLEEIAGIADRDVNHDVVVSGIDASDPNNPQVIVSDPGTGESAATYPLTQFLAAWQDSNFFMAATQEPAPSWVEGMENFDYAAGHIDTVGIMPYEQFASYEESPEQWSEWYDNWYTSVYGDVSAGGMESMYASMDPDLAATLQQVNAVAQDTQGWMNQFNVQAGAEGGVDPIQAQGYADTGSYGAFDPYATMDPMLAASLQQTNALISNTQPWLDQLNAQTGLDAGSVHPNPAVQSTLNMINGVMQDVDQIPDLVARASEGDAAAQAQLDAMNAQAGSQAALLEGLTVDQDIRNSVNESQAEIANQNYTSQVIQDSNQAIIDAQSVESGAEEVIDDVNTDLGTSY